MDENKTELLRKLRALAQRGIGGEKDGAQRKLEELMRKYGVAEADLTGEAEELHDFRYKNEFEKKILIQTFYKIVPGFKEKVYKYTRGQGSRSIYRISCTKAQALQIQIEYEFYCALWQEEVNIFLEAFVQKHGIFAIESSVADQEPMDEEKVKRMVSMMRGMQDKSIRPMIEEKVEVEQ